MLFGLISLARPAITAAKVSPITLQPSSNMFVRGYKIGIHKGAMKRWRKTANGFKRVSLIYNFPSSIFANKYLYRLTLERTTEMPAGVTDI